jgi:uncharacterized protein
LSLEPALVAVDPFEVALGDLRDLRGSRHLVRRATLHEALVADVDSRVPAGAEIVADMVVESFDGGVAVTGRLSSLWEGECRRCMAPLDGELVTEVRELFRRGGGEDEGTYPMAADHINIREMVSDALFAALPLLPMCREDCRGICPRCGTDLNVASCGCEEIRLDPRWSALEVLVSGVEGTTEPGDPNAAG